MLINYRLANNWLFFSLIGRFWSRHVSASRWFSSKQPTGVRSRCWTTFTMIALTAWSKFALLQTIRMHQGDSEECASSRNTSRLVFSQKVRLEASFSFVNRRNQNAVMESQTKQSNAHATGFRWPWTHPLSHETCNSVDNRYSIKTGFSTIGSSQAAQTTRPSLCTTPGISRPKSERSEDIPTGWRT